MENCSIFETEIASPSTLNALELDSLLRVIARFAATDRGSERARSRAPLSSQSALDRRRADYLEIARAIESAGMLVPSEGEPLAPWLGALRSSSGALTNGEMLAVARLMDTIARIDGVLSDPDPFPRWSARIASLRGAEASSGVARSEAAAETLATSIRRVLDDKGKVRANASPALTRLTSGARTQRSALEQSFAGYIDRHRDQLGEETVSLRDGRYSVLLPSGHRGRLAGLVHGRSATGRSFYFEPIELVEANNDLSSAFSAIEEEKSRLLRELEREIRDHGEWIEGWVDLIAELDAQQAAAVFARLTGGALADLEPGPIRIQSGRHPLLDPALAEARQAVLGEPGNRKAIVPLDLDFGDDRLLVVTGPNAGGKTVALKTVGLLVLMTLCGLPIPAGAATRLPRIERVVATVGDEQDLLTDRSTFSGRLLRLEEVWRSARPGALVLVDEIGSGTSPQEGAALGTTLLEELGASGAVGILTTHLVEIASTAMTLPCARSVIMELDAESGIPTFRLENGPPAASEALRLARRLGLPDRWLDRAEQRLGPEQQDLQNLLAETEKLRQQLRRERADHQRLVLEQEELRNRLRADAEALEEERRALRRKVEAEVALFRQQVRSKLEAEVERIGAELLQSEAATLTTRAPIEGQGGAPMRTAKKRRVAQRSVDRLFAGAPAVPAAVEPAAAAAPRGEVEIGDRVRHRQLGWRGNLERLDGERAEVSVAGKRFRCRRAELVRDDESESDRDRPSRPKFASSLVERSTSGVEAELNLIGQRVEPAIERLDDYLDQAMLTHHQRLRVIHGHGTGRLRDAVRRYLKGHPAIASVKPAEQGEGGDGATIVTLREA